MPKVQVSVLIDAPRNVVWDAVEDIGTHDRWMADAQAIRFTSSRRQGPGTTFECDTKVGPFRLTDRMEVVEWAPGEAMGVTHTGLVGGSGRFTLEPARGDRRTRFSWEERLRFPWWLGGPLGALVTKPFLTAIWRRSLRNLKRIIED